MITTANTCWTLLYARYWARPLLAYSHLIYTTTYLTDREWRGWEIGNSPEDKQQRGGAAGIPTQTPWSQPFHLQVPSWCWPTAGAPFMLTPLLSFTSVISSVLAFNLGTRNWQLYCVLPHSRAHLPIATARLWASGGSMQRWLRWAQPHSGCSSELPRSPSKCRHLWPIPSMKR